jgi:hypothetical protein
MLLKFTFLFLCSTTVWISVLNFHVLETVLITDLSSHVIRAGPRRARPGQANNLAPLQTNNLYLLNIFSLGGGGETDFLLTEIVYLFLYIQTKGLIFYVLNLTYFNLSGTVFHFTA